MDLLTKLYVEATTHCNLNCKMCIQRVWDEPVGQMPLATFRALMESLEELPSPPTVHLGGYGEPMMHPDFLEMVRLAKDAGARVEATTNGTLLDAAAAKALIELGMDRLVVSLDGATAGCYEDIRARSSFEQVVGNLRRLYRLKLQMRGRFGKPKVGIAFVAMKRNIDELAALPRLATRVGASEIVVSNVVPHTRAMAGEILYAHALTACTYRGSPYSAEIRLPKFDLDARSAALEPVRRVFDAPVSVSLLGAGLSARNDYCQFAQEGYAVVRWDGQVSPCLPLMHDHPEYLRGRRRQIAHYGLGNVNEAPLSAIWRAPEYAAFRERLRAFPFSPCSTCGGCERFPRNAEDCSLNTFPTCGGCLWAQGFVQCP